MGSRARIASDVALQLSGCGGEPGRTRRRCRALGHAEAALRVLEENTGAARAAASFGASAPTLLALQALHPGVAGLCFISPAAVAPSDLSRLGVPLMAVVGEGDSSLAHAALAAAISEGGVGWR